MARKIDVKKKIVNQIDVIVQIATIIKEDKRGDGMAMKDWVKILFHMHRKGWLYVAMDGNKVASAFGGYMVEEVPESDTVVLPEEEKGDTLFIPFFVPEKKSLPIAAARSFLKNNPNIKRIVYETNDGGIKEHKFHRKESKDEQEKSRTSSKAGV